MDENQAARRARMTVRRYASAADADHDDPSYWRSLTEAERVLQVWRLSAEQWRLRGEWTDESRFSRSTARVHRR